MDTACAKVLGVGDKAPQSLGIGKVQEGHTDVGAHPSQKENPAQTTDRE